MAKKQTQNPVPSVPSKKSKRIRREHEVSPPDLPSNLSNDRQTEAATDPPNELPTDHPADPSKKQAKDLSMSSSKDTGVELSTNTLEDLSTDAFENPTEEFLLSNCRMVLTRSEPITNPFKMLGSDWAPEQNIGNLPVGTISITPTNIRVIESRAFQLHDDVCPGIEEIGRLAVNLLFGVETFCQELVDDGNEKTVDDDEIDRVQQLFDEFGQNDPDFPPRLVAERLGDAVIRGAVVERIINWALITNIAEDGDLNYTLLPHRILTFYRELDRDSSDAHRTLFLRWVELTFGLLAGGHEAHQVSAETVLRTDRIRQFLVKLIGPYCVRFRNHPIFSGLLDQILQWAVAVGYHLMGSAMRYRWDWTWQAPKSKDIMQDVVGKPPPRCPPEEEVPKGKWVTAPALVRETDLFGNQLKLEKTLIAIKQSLLAPVIWVPGVNEMDQEEFDRLEKPRERENRKKAGQKVEESDQKPDQVG